MPARVYMYPAGHAGAGLYTYKLANALAGKGLRITLFGDDQYELDHLPAKFNKAKVLSLRYEDIGENKNIVIRALSIIATHFYNSRKFYSFVKRDKPDIVHLHSFFFYPIEWWLLNRLKKVKSQIVLTVHNVIPYSFYARPLPRMDLAVLQHIYNMADCLIVHSEANKDQLLENFSIEKKKVNVIPHGEYSFPKIHRQVSDAEARCRLNIRADQKIILFFGYIRRIKGIDVLLRAFDKVAKTFPDIVLIIAGSVIEGQSFDECRQIIARMKHAGEVRCFIEYITHDNVPLFFTPADMVVLPYIEFSGQSGVAHLAHGFGKPVIATNVGGLPEAVEDHKTGFIVPAGDVEGLARAMEYLLENESVRVEMGRRARENAIDRFSWGPIAKATIEKVYTKGCLSAGVMDRKN